MKISSKSILSPGRAPLNSLSTSLSRRLRNSGSIKGGASPAMFPTRKRGTFDNPEPSSPKVTCIGQVRVRSKKKQAKKVRTLSRSLSRSLSRRHSAGDASFKKLEQEHGHGYGHDSLHGFSSEGWNCKESLDLGSKRGQKESQDQESQRRWVHFPVTICDALRAFGSEFSCLFPCRKEEKTVVGEGGDRRGSCGAVFARWLVAVEGGEREVELVVGDDDEEEEESVGKPRRHVFEDLEIVDGRIEGHKDEARVSICVPPKNALLLMRCRSDPMKVEALASRSWEPNVGKTEEEDDIHVDIGDQTGEKLGKIQENLESEHKEIIMLDQENVQEDEVSQDQEQENAQEDEVKQDQEQENAQEDEVNQGQEQENVQKYDMGQNQEEHGNVLKNEVGQDKEHDNVQKYDMGQDQEDGNVLKYEVGQDQEHDNVQKYEVGQDQEHVNVQKYDMGQDQEHENVLKYVVGKDQEHVDVQNYEVGQDQFQEHNQTEEESFNLGSLFEETLDQDYEIQEHEETNIVETEAEESTMKTEFAEIFETHEEDNNGVLEKESEKELPECLLMMMYEPKLSMEVSKETWVCRTDFIQHRRKPPPAPAPAKRDDGDESSVTETETETVTVDNVMMMRVADGGLPAVRQQPARSSFSSPAAASMAMVLEQKLEPFVLTRCKSEPMKTAASKLLPESCVLENRKLEGLSRVRFGVGAAGLGF